MACAGPSDEPAHAAAALSAAEPAFAADPASEGASDFLLLDRADPGALTALSERRCSHLPLEARARCRSALAERLTADAIVADRATVAALTASTESMTNEMERRYGAARRALVDDPVTEAETEELHALWIESDEHAEPTEADLAIDEALRAEESDRRAELEDRLGRALP